MRAEWCRGQLLENLAANVDGGRGASHLRGPPLAPWTGCAKRFVMTTELGVG